MHLRADVGGHGQFLDLDLAAWRYGNMGHARGPACRLPFLRRDAGDAHAFTLGKLLGTVTGQAHRSEKRVAQALRTTVVVALAIEQVDPELRGILAGGIGEFVDHAFDRPERPAWCDRPQLTR